MKKFAIFMFLIFSLSAFTGCANTNSNTKDNYPDAKVFSDKDLGVELKYPKDWEKITVMPNVPFQIACPGTDNRCNINLVIEKLPNKSMNLDQYKSQSIESLNKAIPGLKERNSGKAKLAGADGFYIVYEGNLFGMDFIWKQICTIKNGYAYVLTYTGDQNTFDTYLKDFDVVINTFKITGKPKNM